MKISITLPVRGRPQLLHRFIESTYNHATNGPEIETILYLDNDDPSLQDYLELIEYLNGEYYDNIRTLVGPRTLLSETSNKLYPLCKADIIMLTADDFECQTHDWDSIVIDEFNKVPDGIMLLGCDDLHNYNLYTAFFLHRKWVEAVGYFVYAFSPGMYVDTFFYDIAVRIGRNKMLPIVFKHHHWSIKAREMDSIDKEKLSKEFGSGKPVNVLFDETLERRIADAEKLRKAMHE